MEEHKPTADSKEQISLKELLLKVRDGWRYLLSRWLIIGVFAIVGAALGYVLAITKKPKYVADLNFVLEESKSGSLGSYAGIASQFGIDIGGGGSGVGVFSGDNIIEFLKSRFIIEKALLSTVKIDGKEQTLASYYIDINKLRARWAKLPELQHVNYPTGADRATFTRQQDSVLNQFYEDIVNFNLTVAKKDKKLSFVGVSVVSGNELFSKMFCERLVKEATDFYVQTKTKRSKANVDVLQAKADSLETLLSRRTYSAAVAEDLNLNPARRIASVGSEIASRDKIVVQTVYGEVVKNLELSRLSMSQETPIIQIIDTPILPLQVEKLGRAKGIVLGLIAGIFLTSFVLLLRKMVKEIMS
ncbi:Chain length determinant protein [Chitinophaga sp. YR573]|uniref:lipopolysaccharide biosynthesis protein n=1 Tax=Chitinophaga sp. YR573 TaxID=1881040 RepID=UPI0008C9530B|nr:lipopolysaccharide biosynthesis protein [Chitinophaga sp. YR573]SEW14386.1 Chain length determinant protein [Chitinophaga sp. YR573]